MGIPESIVLRGISYRIQRPEQWAVVFTEECPIGGKPRRFMLHRSPHICWHFEHVQGWGDPQCSHIVSAYEFCKARIGDDFAQNTVPEDDPEPHDWKYDEGRRMTYCAKCKLDKSESIKWRSCDSKRKAVQS